MAETPTPHEVDRIELVVPLQARFASTVRLLAASLAADAGFSVDEIDDLRLAISEVFSLLAEGRDGQRAVVGLDLGGATITCTLAPEHGDAVVAADELARTILQSVVDRCEFGTSAITLSKTAAEAATI